jgi:hypothetical protein
MSPRADFMLKRLILPLSIAIAAVLLLAVFLPWRGLFISIAATLSGSLVTVCYIDQVLLQHERTRWAHVKGRIDKQIEHIACLLTGLCRIAFDFGTEVYDDASIMSADWSRIRKDVIRVSSEIVRPAVSQRIRRLQKGDWAKLTKQLQIARQQIDRVLELHGSRLEPCTISILMDIQAAIDRITMVYLTFPDVLGVPETELPVPRNGSVIKLRQALEHDAALETEKILTSAAALLRGVEGSQDQ